MSLRRINVVFLLGCPLGLPPVLSVARCLDGGLLPISVNDQTFADSLRACMVSQPSSCTASNILILLAVPVLFGFSERALQSFEHEVFR